MPSFIKIGDHGCHGVVDLTWNDPLASVTNFITLSYLQLQSLNDNRNHLGMTLDLVLSNLLNVQVERNTHPLVVEDIHHPALLLTVNVNHLLNAKKSRTGKVIIFVKLILISCIWNLMKLTGILLTIIKMSMIW